MSDQSKLGIGHLITTDQQRDAIHVAVAPATAGESLAPGDHVGVLPDGRISAKAETHIGVVDPFLQVGLRAGQRCWLFMYPGTITSLRHDWTHPGLGASDPECVSKRWLEAYAAQYFRYDDDDCDIPTAYARLMDGIRSGELTYIGTDMHSLGDLVDADLLLQHASVVLGRGVDWGTFEYFSCSC